MIRAKTEFDACKEVFISSTPKLFELLFEDIPIRHPEYATFLADRGVYIIDSNGYKLLRLECREGKKLLLQELHDRNIEPQTVLDTYLGTLFAVFEQANIKEKTTLAYYTGNEFVEPIEIKVIGHPSGFMKGSFTLFDELISKNYRSIRLDKVKKPPTLTYDPLEAFDNRISNSSILIFEKDTLRELAVMSFENFLKVKEIFIHTTHFHINAVFFGYLKFKIRKMQGI
ncbi:hypothetical protein E3E26_05420 [Thermococcus sp. LS1]|uniref:hypothetical protein n=1 Tax=Thermococcus sp. LS1 TaxID=1638259 RepID=UPI00143949FE|nr:hypothetical protein [Thermococcus sp. LS1]NJD99220.1 hypothetical protein [Thermococcus sp. LS1]